MGSTVRNLNPCLDCGENPCQCCDDIPETNVQFVTKLMEYSRYGALAQLFVIDALAKWSKYVAEVPTETLTKEFGETPFINPVAWQGVAKEIQQKLKDRK